MRMTGAVLCAVLLQPAVAQTARPAGPVAELVKISVPGMGTFGSDAAMVTHVFKPAGNEPYPVVLFSHGRAGDAATRSRLAKPVALGHVRFWLAKGYAVVAPVRPGYGDTGGLDTESSGSVYSATGECRGQPDPSRTAKAAVRSTNAALQ